MFLWTILQCKVRINEASIDSCNNMLPHTFLLIYNKITRTSIYVRIFYTFIPICAIKNQLILFFPLLFYSCACKRLVNLYSRNTHIDILDEDILFRYHYTCKNQQFNFYVNLHFVWNVLIFFTVYIIIKINPIQVITCYAPARCLQLIKWMSYMNIISAPCHQSIILIMYIPSFIILPMSLDIINIMESIYISLTYNVLNVFDCIPSPVELMLDYFRYTIIYPRGSFQHLVSYMIISILLLIETVLLSFTIHPTIRYINITFTLISLIVYLALMLTCFLVCLSSFNVLIMLCGIRVHYISIINPHPHIHGHPNNYPLIRNNSKMSMFDDQYEYQLYINQYSCAIYFYNRDRGISFCCKDSISKCFTSPYICMHYGGTRYASHDLWVNLNVWIETYYDTLESILLALFIYKSIIPVCNDITPWAKYIYNPLFCTSRVIYLCGGRRFWVKVGRVEYGNLLYPP